LLAAKKKSGGKKKRRVTQAAGRKRGHDIVVGGWTPFLSAKKKSEGI